MILIGLSALVVTVLLLMILIPVSHRVKLLAYPGEHRQHAKPTPLIGGIGIYLGLITVSSIFSIEIPQSVFLAMIIVFVFGVIDDRWTVPYGIRFVVQIAAAIILVNDGVVLNHLGHLVSDDLVTMGKWRTALTVFSIVGVINALNMIDGLDGLVGMIMLIVLSGLTYILIGGQNLDQLMLCVAVLGGLLGFLFFNLRSFNDNPARVFMGDGGSMAFGLFLAWLFITMSQDAIIVFPPVLSLWLFAIPLFDTVGVMLRRMGRGLSPFHADRLHTHHLLLNFGFTVNQVLLILVVVSVGLATIAIYAVGMGIRESSLFFIFLCLFFVYIVAMEIGQYVTQR